MKKFSISSEMSFWIFDFLRNDLHMSKHVSFPHNLLISTNDLKRLTYRIKDPSPVITSLLPFNKYTLIISPF